MTVATVTPGMPDTAIREDALHPGALFDAPDLRYAAGKGGSELLEQGHPFRRDGEAKLVVVPFRRGDPPSLLAFRAAAQRARERKMVEPEPCAHPTRAAQVAQIRNQAVGYVDCGGSNGAKGNTDRHPRSRPAKPRPCVPPDLLVQAQFAVVFAQREARISHFTGDVDAIASPCPGAGEGRPSRECAEHGNTYREVSPSNSRTGRLESMWSAGFLHAPVQSGDTHIAAEFHEERGGECKGPSAHRGKVAQVDRNRLVADVGRVAAGREVHAVHQGVDGDRDLLIFGDRYPHCVSVGRVVLARRSSTPFTNLWLCSAPNVCASSTPWLTITRHGTSLA